MMQGRTVLASALCLLCLAVSTTAVVGPSAVVGSTTTGASPVRLPIVERAYEHEAVQYGYSPDYIVNTPSFDSKNRPYIRSRTASLDETGFVEVLESGRWVARPFVPAIEERFPDFVRFEKGGGWLSSRVVFDEADGLYTCVQIVASHDRRVDVLLYSTDYGEHFQAYALPSPQQGEHRALLEHRSGQGVSLPPMVVLSQQVSESRGDTPSVDRLSVLRPVKRDGALVIPEPVVVTDRCLGLSVHSGGSAFAVTIGQQTHVVWVEVAETPGAPGTPTYIATYDAGTQTLGAKVLLGYAHPANDVHCMPGICADSKGYLHVLLGAHGKPFQYTRSLKPDDVFGGWTRPEEILTTGFGGPRRRPGGEGRQTYAAMLCGADDTLHLVFRQGLYSEESPYFPGKAWNALAYQRKRPNEGWLPPQLLVVPPASGYAVFYHTLARDRRGRLYLVYSYRGGEPLKLYYGEMAGIYHYPAMLTSRDGGTTWELAETEHFEAAASSRAPDIRGGGDEAVGGMSPAAD